MKRFLLLMLLLLPALAIPQSSEVKLGQWGRQLASGGIVNEVSTGNKFQPSASIQRENDRVFIGGATKNDGLFPPVSLDWLSTYEDSIGYTNFTMYGKLSVLSDTNANDGVGITSAVQTKTFTSAATAGIGIESWCLHNNTTFANGCWAYYGESHKRINSGTVYGAEFDIHTGFTATVPTPYRQGDTVVLQLADGAGVGGASFTGSIALGTPGVLTVASGLVPQLGHLIGVGDNIFCSGCPSNLAIASDGTGSGGLGTYNLNQAIGSNISSEAMAASQDFASAAAMQVQNNIVPFNAGIVFGQYAIAGTDGVTGLGAAIEFATNHAVEWFNPSNQETAQITSTVVTQSNGTKLTFTDNGLCIGMLTVSAIDACFGVQGSTGANYLSFLGKATGQAPTIAATGSDTNINLRLQAQGTGVIAAAAGIMSAGTQFTVTGCGVAGSLTGGGEAGTFTVGTGASPCTFVIKIANATTVANNGWICVGYDETSGIALVQTTQSSTTCSLKGNAATSDVIAWSVARGY